MKNSRFFKYRTEKEQAIFDRKLARLKAERNKNPKLKKAPLKIIEACKIFIELYQKYNKCPASIPNLAGEKGSYFYDYEPDAYAFKLDVEMMNEENKDVRDFFLRKNLKRYDKNQDEICKLCKFYEDYKDTGICEGSIFPVKDWKNKIEKKV